MQSRRRLEAARPRVFGAGGEQRRLLAPGAGLRAGRARKGSSEQTRGWGAAQGHARSFGKAGSWAAPLPTLGTALGARCSRSSQTFRQRKQKSSQWLGPLGVAALSAPRSSGWQGCVTAPGTPMCSTFPPTSKNGNLTKITARSHGLKAMPFNTSEMEAFHPDSPCWVLAAMPCEGYSRANEQLGGTLSALNPKDRSRHHQAPLLWALRSSPRPRSSHGRPRLALPSALQHCPNPCPGLLGISTKSKQSTAPKYKMKS